MGWEMASLENNHGTGQGTKFDIEPVTFDKTTRYREEHDRHVCLFADTNIFCGVAQMGTKWPSINHWLCLRFCNHWAQITQAMHIMHIILRLIRIRAVSSTAGSAYGGYEIFNERCLLMLQLALDQSQ